MSRSRLISKVATRANLWCAAVVLFAVALYIIFVIRIGRVVYVIDAAAGHGIHSGDIYGVLAGLLGMACLIAGTRRR